MSNQINMYERTKANSGNLKRYKECVELLGINRATVRKMALECGALHEKSKTLVYIDYPLLEEYIRGH